MLFLKKTQIQVSDKKVPYGIPKGLKVSRSDDVFRVFGFLLEAVQEEVYALYTDARNMVVGFYQVAKGSIDGSFLQPADVLRPALVIGASSIILIHNHPSGNPEPSTEDTAITKKIKEACQILGFTLLDHVIIGNDGYFSFVDNNKL